MIMNELNLNGAVNLRDLGGLPTVQGKKTKKGKLYRSGSLDRLSSPEIERLVEQGISLDIDLRGDEEVQRWVDLLGADERVRYEVVPLLPSIKPEELPKILSAIYLCTLDQSKKDFYHIFSLMLENVEKATLFHCSLGKDRTGMVAALLFLLAEVPRPLIIEDYMQSQTNLKGILEKMEEMNDPALKVFLTAREEDIVPFLDAIDDDYGGVTGYFREIGFSDKEIERIKAILV